MTALPRLHTILLFASADDHPAADFRLLSAVGCRVETIDDIERLHRRLAELGDSAAVVLSLRRADDEAADLLAGLAHLAACPILVLLTEGGARERTALLERGAADVMSGPFLAAEIRARLLARWRSAGWRAQTAEPIRFGRYRLDPGGRTVCDEAGAPIALTAAEFDLLAVLLAADGRPLSRSNLLDATRRRHWETRDRSIDVLIGRLRRKLEADPRQPRLLLSVRGFGYRLLPKTVDAPQAASTSPLVFARRAAGFSGT